MNKVFRFLCVMIMAVLLPVGAQATRYYVTLNATGTGASWADPMPLANAISNTMAGDEIWIQGYDTPGGNHVYRVPDANGFTVKSGVKIYGGFAGTETSIDDREIVESKAYRMKYRTVISGDVSGNDVVDATNLIFPANSLRSDNATHVLTLDLSRASGSNQNSQSTVINGVTIARGHATGGENEAGGRGGGILVTADGQPDAVSYSIERCFFIANYATRGGALYVESGCEGTVSLSGFFNNAAGERSGMDNSGGAIWLAGGGTVVNTAVFNNENGGIMLQGNGARVLNSTVVRNTGAGIDGAGHDVDNTVVWGNSLLSMSDVSRPNFRHSAYPEANPGGTDSNGNVYLADKNNEAQGPHFSAPSLKIGFDTDYDMTTRLYPLWTWEPVEATPLVDAGDDTYYYTDPTNLTTAFGPLDLGLTPRRAGAHIDIGAFEFQPVMAGRIRYVRPHGTGDGSSWADASADIQQMIDYLADNNPQGLPGEVWVAAGEYEPRAQLITGTAYSASFRMRDGISVYGGFSNGSPEATKAERKKTKGTMPWQYDNETILSAANYSHSNLSFNASTNRWSTQSDSRHVVWFAPLGQDAPAFSRVTVLDGFTIRGGYAQGNTGLTDFLTDRGAGVYIDGENAYLQNCVVKENNATGDGGGVYLKEGRVQGSLIYNNNAGGNGGAVYVSDRGLVHRSMLTNNSARNGAGVYLHNVPADTDDHPEYLILSTCVVSNNTAIGNGAVYCDGGGVLLQNTITNNWTPTSTDLTDPNASQTGGLYIDTYALVANSVIWNNRIGGGTTPANGTNVPMFARNQSAQTVRFLYNAISGTDNAVWNSTLQEQTLKLVDTNSGTEGSNTAIGPRFEIDTNTTGSTNISDKPEDIETNKIGVQRAWTAADGTAIDYYWKPRHGSNLWARGMAIGQLPDEVVLAPEIDIEGELFAQKPGVGAFHVEGTEIVPALEDGDTLVVYVDAECTEPEHKGTSWAEAYRSLNDAIKFFAGLTTGKTGVRVMRENGELVEEITITDSHKFEIRTLEGDLWPRYAFVNDDPKTATLDILAMQDDGRQLRIVGGYHRNDAGSASVVRDPLTYRSQLNGNSSGSQLEDGLYHVVTVEPGASVELDGFHVINGYAAGAASLQYGAGMLVRDGATVTLTNCIFENNTAATGAAIDARDATLIMRNCVVNNNTNTSSSEQLINCPDLTMHHVSIVNNVGAAPANTSNAYSTSFAAGNVSDKETGATDGMNNTITLATTGADGAKNFANPTNKQGATLGFDTYLGGYSSFRPLTSSEASATNIINKGGAKTIDTDTDIMGNERDLGGAADLGAYEADLPRAGKVIYVRSYNQEAPAEESDGNPDMNASTAGDGSSWANAINGNAIYDLDEKEDFYVRNGQSLQKSSYENEAYRNGAYRPTSGHYGAFWDGTHNKSPEYQNSNIITNNRDERYVSGLQYAIEKASEWNKNHPESERIDVWVGAGIYTDYKGFVIRDSVRVYGGFPKDGTPGEDDRMALLSGYIPSRDDTQKASDYETILQIRKESPVTWTNNNKGNAASWLSWESSTLRHYVLYQPDVCVPTWAVENNNADKKGANRYRYNEDPQHYVEYTRALWDGFTVRHGYIKNYEANRDGGAGVRAFRGVTLQNLVVVNNYTHGDRSRGGGLYMDGLNSVINNSFLVNNLSSGAESYGGGAYMIVGTGFNMVVANNHAEVAGGGLFIESATFYNNTVAFNRTGDRKPLNQGNGSGIFQYAEDNMTRPSKLGLYNCIIYGNVGVAYVDGARYTNYQITSSAPTTFDKPYNCYVSGRIGDNIRAQFVTNDNVYRNQVGEKLPNPFARGNSAQSENNYRLAAGSTCLNSGTENLGKGVSVPSTDMDYTNRIKDCAIDIGAYELDNEENIKYTLTGTQGNYVGTYYVSQNGVGSRSGENAANAACAMKLQDILTDAGEEVKNGTLASAVVRLAGYEADNAGASFVYHANTLADKNNPQSYTFVVPAGVTLEGGYYEGTTTNGNYNGDGWDVPQDSDHVRNVMRFRTVLSAVAVPTQGSTVTQEVNGYHVVTFGGGDGTAALDKPAVIDGLWLTDGSATSMAGAGSADTRGGGAIVPAGAHVRNCVVENCAAIEGGGLYLLPGATVSGTAVLRCTASYGGGIYADSTNAADSTRAHIISCTVADNEAEVSGGGISMEEGAAMAVNTVVWGNDAQADKNVSGVTHERFADTRLAEVFDDVNEGSYYPFNDCFVETQELPSDFENASMVSDSTVYFDTSDHYRTLKEFSPLIKHGVKADYHGGLERVFGVAEADIQNIERSQEFERTDAGAFAYDGGVLPTALFTRIFVSPTSNVKLAAGEDINDYLGRSFYTSFTTLDDALSYIKTMRDGDDTGDDTHFEILMAAGTYKPTTARTTTATGVIHDQRLYSFVVPHNVSIYGGFSGTETISCGIDIIPASDGDIAVTNGGEISAILAGRDYSDFNQNGIKESWELANQTILSGNINVSAEADNVYHVVYAEAGDVIDPQPIVLDGLTVMNGQTSHSLTAVNDNNEVGRGGGLYSDGVAVTLNRCRFTNNFGVRGGAVFVRDARLSIVGSIFAGNGWTPEMGEPDIAVGTQPARGGAVFVSGLTTEADLYAVNTLFVNNETVGQGGAIGTNYAEGITGNYDPLIDLMNCTFARNKAATNAVIYNHNGKSQLTNTLIWGNESENYNDQTDAAHMTISHSASDYNYGEVFGTGSNVLLSADNSATNGPRFTNPATVAGVSGNDATNLWNPAAISVATDAGAGTLQLDGTYDPKTYEVWFGQDKGMTDDYQSQYMGTADYARYSGPTDDNNNPAPKPIDIGVYEYQYISNFSTMLEIYVDTVQAGDGSGNSWENATADLRGAIVGASNPSQNDSTRTVYVRDGDYMLPRASAGSVFVLNMSGSDLSDSLIVKGSCTGVGDAQDFDRQTVLRNHPQATSAQTTLLSVNANSKDVVIEGFSFINGTDGGQGVVANAHGKGSLRMRNCAFRMNQGTGMTVTNSTSSNGNGPVLIYNTLFADGGTGLAGNDKTTVVNATFANNDTTDFSVSEGHTLAGIYNSVAWNNKEQNLNYVGGGAEQIPGNGNSSISVDEGADPAENNADIHDGPNFVDPLNADKELRDYHIRPSLTLLNAGENDTYEEKVRTDPADDVDLGSNSRLVDGQIDIGAYEYDAPLRPIVYVKAGVVAADADGSSWERPLADLQGAADLVGIYAHNNADSTGYVFVHNNVDGQPLRLSLDNVKVYGGMSDETSTTEVKQDADGKWQNVGTKVYELLAARKGLLESAARTELSSVTVDVIEFKDSYNAVADGFIVNDSATVNRGTLSTSVVRGDVKMTRTEDTGKGLLYNTLVYSGVSGGVKTVNVTATGEISGAAEGSANNRSGVSETNAYVTDGDWRYQLMETSADIDPEGNDNSITITKACINMVGHSRDIAGNKRIRQTVDNGCFETWDINHDGVAVTDQDYPRGKSVVYVRKDKELLLNRDYAADAPFCPGVLLLEHQAGLRGNGKNVGLNHVIMERNVPAGDIDMTGVPFRITAFKKGDGDGLAVKYYDGKARAAYDYAFDGTDGKAWSEDISADINSHRSGLLLDNTGGTAEARARFIGKRQNAYAYTEGPDMNSAKEVTLSYFNFSDPWTSPDQQSNRFTHKENMSWNLFGSPYLCAMNYSDMEYGRVIYGYSGGNYKTVNTSDADASGGYIPAGDAVFTQTATLNANGETFAVDQPNESNVPQKDNAYAGMASLQLTVAAAGDTRAATGCSDVLQLNAVEAAAARSDFDMSADGVKWMAAGAPQIYATRGGARYSLLSAVSRDGEVGVGLTLPSAGTYTIGIPEDCAAEGYETVLLKDAATGRTVDLLEDAYDFSADAAGDVAGRFTISFNRTGTDRFSSGITISSPAPATVAVSGLERGDVVRVYSASGVMAAQTVASAQSVRMAVRLSGIAVVEVARGGKTVKAGKVRVN